MMLNEKYLRRALSVPYGKWVLGVQALLMIALMLAFMQVMPWLVSTDVAEIRFEENPSPPPPAWARAFSVDHGEYRYFAHSRSDHPIRMWASIGSLGLGLLLWLLLSGYVWVAGGRRLKTDEGTDA